MTSLRPLRTFVVIRPDTQEDYRLDSLDLVVPAGTQPESCTGTLLAIGPDVESFSVGDRVLFAPLGGQQEMVDGVSYILMHWFELRGTISVA